MANLLGITRRPRRRGDDDARLVPQHQLARSRRRRGRSASRLRLPGRLRLRQLQRRVAARSATCPTRPDARRIREQHFASDDGLADDAPGYPGPAVRDDGRDEARHGALAGARSPHVHVGRRRRVGADGPVRQLYAEGLMGEDVGYVHCTSLGDDELQLIADTGGTTVISRTSRRRCGARRRRQAAQGRAGAEPLGRLHDEHQRRPLRRHAHDRRGRAGGEPRRSDRARRGARGAAAVGPRVLGSQRSPARASAGSRTRSAPSRRESRPTWCSSPATRWR